MTRYLYLLIALISALMLLPSTASYADELECTLCHSDKTKGKDVHPPVMMGCATCHSGVDPSEIPHKFTGYKGLMAEGLELCTMCHDASKFTGKANVHVPVQSGMCTSCHDPHSSASPKLMKTTELQDTCFSCHDETLAYGPTIHQPVSFGMCTSCHEPHQSDNAKLLTLPQKDLCVTCHDSAEFNRKSQHGPVKDGLCTECHLPHAAQNEFLLYRRGNLLCRKCHPDVEKKPHALTGFSAEGHPIRGRKDPNMAGKTFGCQSCHMQHSSDYPRLFRYKAETVFDLCSYCHDI